MTILDRVGETARTRIDTSQLADELAKRIPADLTKHLPDDVDPIAWATSTVNDLRRDLTKAGSDLNLDGRLDEVSQKIRQAVSTPTLRTVIARLERELPDTDTDRYERAYKRGRVQARSIYLGLGLAAGVTAGVVAALLLDPRNGKARRGAIADKAGSVTRELSGRAQSATERAKDMAVERGIIKPQPVTDKVADQVEAAATQVEDALAPLAEVADAAVEPAPIATEPSAEPIAESRPLGA